MYASMLRFQRFFVYIAVATRPSGLLLWLAQLSRYVYARVRVGRRLLWLAGASRYMYAGVRVGRKRSRISFGSVWNDRPQTIVRDSVLCMEFRRAVRRVGLLFGVSGHEASSGTSREKRGGGYGTRSRAAMRSSSIPRRMQRLVDDHADGGPRRSIARRMIHENGGLPEREVHTQRGSGGGVSERKPTSECTVAA